MFEACVLIHGGAGAMDRLGWVGEKQYREGLRLALEAAVEVMEADAPALQIVVAAVRAMEENGVFNAGVGACLNRHGEVELDTAVMEGAELGIGAIGGMGPVQDPMGAALAVLKESPHVLLVGSSATAFAERHGIALLDPPVSRERLEEWAERKQRFEEQSVGQDATEQLTAMSSATGERGCDTVGAVAIDAEGNMAVAVSTGGIWLKEPGRVGDSPIPGSGFWAENGVGAVCATGTGELILRTLLCRRVTEAMEAGADAMSACRTALDALEERFGTGTAGLIAIDERGRPGLVFNTAGMGTALAWRGEREIAIFPGESSLCEKD